MNYTYNIIMYIYIYACLWVKTLLACSSHQHSCDFQIFIPSSPIPWGVHMMGGLRGTVLKHIIQKGVFPQGPNGTSTGANFKLLLGGIFRL